MDFKQKITVNNVDYTFFITKTSLLTTTMLLLGHGLEFKGEFNNIDAKALARLKNALQKENGLFYNASVIEDGSGIQISPQHECCDINEVYILDKSPKDASMEYFLQERIEAVEKSIPTIYLIEQEMIGPCIELGPMANMSLEKVNELMNKVIITDAENKAKNPASILVNDNEWKRFMIQEFYVISYVYSKKIPVITKNELLFNKIIKNINRTSVGHFHVLDINNGYTVLSRKYEENIVGFITKTPKEIVIRLSYFKFNIGNTCANVFKKEQNNVKCSEEDYYTFCYLLKLPFNIEDGLYFYIDAIVNQTKVLLIKENAIYFDIENVKSGNYTGYSPREYNDDIHILLE